jgi:hypothetical protein
MPAQSSKAISSLGRLRDAGLSTFRREKVVLLFLFVLGFVSRFIPLLQFPRVGFDPFFHYQFSMALLEGKTSIVAVTQFDEHITLYYPPLFHLLSLSFFLAFPTVDPYLIMKLIVSVLDSLIMFPIYYIVKDVSKSTAGAMAAAFLAAAAPSDLHMISWGGYANIMGLLLMAVSVYLVMKGKVVGAGLAFTALFLTHHLTMLFAVAVFVPYFLIVWWKTRRLPRGFIASVMSGIVAYAVFYWYTLLQLYEIYTRYAPRYAEFTLPTNWPQMIGIPILVLAVAGVGLWIYKTRTHFAQSGLLLYVWFLMPLLLGYAYLFGVQWHTIRWIYFLQQPAYVWAGIAVSQVKNRERLLAIVLIVLILQWVSSMQSYYSDILSNAGYTY